MLPKVQMRPNIFEFYQREPPCIFLKFSVCRKHWMSLNDLFLGFSKLCDFFTKYVLWKKNNFSQIFPVVVPWIFLSLTNGADLGRSRLVFSSDYNPHTDRSTFLTILTILKSYNSYLANLKYWRKSLRSSILTSSKKLKGPKGTPLEYFRLSETFFSKKNSPKGPPFNLFGVFRQNGCWKIPKVPPFSFFGIVRLFSKKIFFHQKCPSFNFFW